MIELNSKYRIDRDEDHNYSVTIGDTNHIVPGVTGILNIVGSEDKVNRLMGWAKKNCLLKAAEHIRSFAGKQLIVDEAWIESVRKSAWKRDKEMLKAAGDIGTRVHNAIDAYIAGDVPTLDADTKQGFDNFLAWLKESRIKLIKGDTYVANLALGYGGALDAIGERDGKIILLDWKTSNYLQDANALQTAAYYLAFFESFNVAVDAAYVVRFGKDKPGDVEPKEVNLKNAESAWLKALELHKAIKESVWEVK
jgi:CRISPR/Cas system-associated exonuclease Cas4 (RecB family)